jgi:hypothetical protein
MLMETDRVLEEFASRTLLQFLIPTGTASKCHQIDLTAFRHASPAFSVPSSEGCPLPPSARHHHFCQTFRPEFIFTPTTRTLSFAAVRPRTTHCRHSSPGRFPPLVNAPFHHWLGSEINTSIRTA